MATQLGVFCGPSSWDGSDLGGDTPNTADQEQHLWAGSRHFSMQRHYRTWPQVGVAQIEKDAVAAGRNVYVEIAADYSVGASWAAIAAGKYDPLITAHAVAYKNWWNGLAVKPADKFMFVFQHEPDTDTKQGNATAFKAAFKHFTNIWRSVDVPCLYVFNLNGAWGGRWQQWVPELETFDLVGSDRYNKGPAWGARWRSFEVLHTPAHNYAISVGKPLCVGESGCQENPQDASGPNSKQQWFRDMASTCTKWGDVAWVCYTSKGATPGSTKDVNYLINTSPQAAQAFRDIGSLLS